MVILSSLQSIISISIMISLGYYLTYKGWFDDNISNLFAKFVVTVSLPCFMVSNLLSSFTKETLLTSGKGFIIPFISMFSCYLIAKLVSKLIRLPAKRRGVFETMFFISNTIFIGLPVNLALFGDISVPYVLLYYIANTVLFWTVAVYEIGRSVDNSESKIFSLQNFKRIFSPPMIGFILAVIFILLEIKPPAFILDTCKYFGNMTTPLSMLFIGITIYSVDLKNFTLSIDKIAIILGRFVISPLVVFIISQFIHVPEITRNVFIVQAAMPVMTQVAIIAKAYNSDYEYTAIMASITTVLSIIFIPIYMYIFTLI